MKIFSISYIFLLFLGKTSELGGVRAKEKVIMVFVGAKEVKEESLEHFWYLAVGKFVLNYWI